MTSNSKKALQVSAFLFLYVAVFVFLLRNLEGWIWQFLAGRPEVAQALPESFSTLFRTDFPWIFFILLPLGISLSFGLKHLDSPKKFFLKSAQTGAISSFVSAVIIEALLFIFNGQGHPSAAALWPFYSWIYVLGSAILSLVLVIYFVFYTKVVNKRKMLWITAILLLLPYLWIAFESYQKASYEAYDNPAFNAVNRD